MTVVAVTGGARGIGRAIAQRLAADGMRVAIGDLDAELARQVGAQAGLRLDVTDADLFASFLSHVEEQLGEIDVLVNNAGIMPIGHFLEQDSDVIDRALDVNLKGTLNGVRAVLPRKVDRGGGHIVNISSAAGKIATPGGAVYAATKFGVVGLSDAIRQEFARHGITVTTVMPSFTRTELIAGTTGLRGLPTAQPQDVANAVARALRRKKATVYVPRAVRASVLLNAILPTRVNDMLSRVYRSDREFLEFDHAQRAAYDLRVSKAAGRVPDSWNTPIIMSAGSSTVWNGSDCSRTRCSSTSSATTAPRPKAPSTARSTRCCRSMACRRSRPRSS